MVEITKADQRDQIVKMVDNKSNKNIGVGSVQLG